MKKIVHRSVIPIYAAAAVWLVASLLLPMYAWIHYIIYAALAVGAYFLAQKFFPGTVEEVELPEAPPDTGNKEVDQLILSGREQLKEMRRLGDAIRKQSVTAKVDQLEVTTKKIFSALEEDPVRLGSTRKFLNYYLPTTVNLLRRYQALERQNVSGKNITETMEKIEGMLETVSLAYERQLDNLYAADAMDITADIQVMQQMMAAEGLLQNDTNELL